MKKLTEVDIFYINGNVNKKTPEQIAKDLGCTIDDVTKQIQKSKLVKKDLYAKDKNKGYVSMTEAASQAIDEFVDNHGTGVQINEDHIHRPLG